LVKPEPWLHRSAAGFSPGKAPAGHVGGLFRLAGNRRLAAMIGVDLAVTKASFAIGRAARSLEEFTYDLRRSEQAREPDGLNGDTEVAHRNGADFF
jgi:hypothetical protein